MTLDANHLGFVPLSNVIEQRIVALAREHGVLRARDVEAAGIHRKHLAALIASGVLEQPGRGLYRLADEPLDEMSTLAEIATRVPDGVVCLLSALSIHQLTTQSPSEIWLAIAPNAWAPTSLPARIHLVRMAPRWLDEGVETRDVTGTSIRVTNPARTVVDCFRLRNLVGLDVAIEALRDAWHQRLVTVDELAHLARERRVWSVMRPYVETVVS